MAEDNLESNAVRTRRRLRPATETVREKAVKAQEQAEVNRRPSRKRRAASGPFRGLAWLSHQPPLRQIGHSLRWFFTLKPLRFLGRLLGFGYVAGSWRELRLVTWPTGKQSRQLTYAVVVFSVIFGALIALVDFGLNKLFKEVIIK